MYRLSTTLFIFILSLCIIGNATAQNFYDMSEIQEIHVHFAENNWDQLMDNAYASTGEYILADSVVINEITYDSVGVKFKGNSTYRPNQIKNPWHIELDTYKEQDHQGFKDIKLANAYKDPSFIRDVLAYHVVRQYMHAPQANFANLYVNGTLIGLYSNTEAISKTFVDDRFGSKNNTFLKCSPPDGAGPQSDDFPNLVYMGQDSAAYYDAYELKSDNGWQELIDLCNTLGNNTANIEDLLDVDRAMWMLAFDNVIVNLDSYIGQFKQNYYLYQDDFGRFLSVVWDLNESFGVFSNTGSGNLNNTTAKQQMSHLLHINDSAYPLISELLANPSYKRMYLAHLKTLLTENFGNDGSYIDMAESLRNTIDAAVQADPNKFYSYQQFMDNLDSDTNIGGGPGGGSVPGISTLMNGRHNYLLAQGDFTVTQPEITDIIASESSPTIGSSISISAFVSDEESVHLRYRSETLAPFERIEMFDDGNHNDGAANDNIFGAEMPINSIATEYYIYAENDDIGVFSPARAQHEFYTISATGGIQAGDIVINEFMASNDMTIADQNGDFDDWIELYNNSDAAIDISGYGLSDDAEELDVFQFPEGTILQPDDYIVVWADKDDDQEGFHADFKISADGETIYLSDMDQFLLDSVAFGVQTTDVAFGRFPNGTGPFQFLPATFGAENSDEISTNKKEQYHADDIMIYPNPVRDLVTIEINSNTSKTHEITIFSAVGTMVESVVTSESITTIGTSNWQAGMYFVRIGNQVKRLVVTED